jgi:asparagine synthase (glutamine-hydrolysing)
MDGLVQAIEAETEPFDCLMNLNRAVYLQAREKGIHALLDGVDGDVLLSGSGHLTQLWRQGAYRTIVRETLKADGLTAEYKSGRRELTHSFLSAFTPFPPAWLRRVRRQRHYRNAVEEAVEGSLIQRDFAVRSRLRERFAMLDSHSPRLRSFRQVEAHKLALEHPFLTVGLERYERVATSFGIEARHPFADVRLAEFCLGLPWHLKTQKGWTKMILRRALEPDLPREVIWRKDKDSLMWEVNRSILKARAEYFYQITSDECANLQPYVDTQKLMKFWDEYLILNDETHAESLWSGTALAMWLQRQRDMNVCA